MVFYASSTIQLDLTKRIKLDIFKAKNETKGHFYLKNKFQEVTEKNMNVLHKGMQGY